MKAIRFATLCTLVITHITSPATLEINDEPGANPQIVAGHIVQIIEHAVDMAEHKDNIGQNVAGIFANILGIVLQAAQKRGVGLDADEDNIIRIIEDTKPEIVREVTRIIHNRLEVRTAE